MMHQDSDQRSEPLTRLLDQQEIRDVLHRYCQGVDRKNWDQVLSCYHEDAIDSHGAYSGSPAGLVRWMQGTHEHVDFSMHVLTNTTVTFAEDARRARTESYVVCYKSLSSAVGDAFLTGTEDGPVRRTVASRFIDVLEDRGSGWRIARRDVVLEFARREDDDLYLPFATDALVSRRDALDLLYTPAE